jgi:hypothetical protein
MPAKTWQPPPGQQDRERQLTEPPAAEPRSSDMLLSGADTNADARPVEGDLSAYGHEDINTEGSER